MRVALIILLVVIAFEVSAQSKFYIGTNGDYAILIDERAVAKSATPESGGYVDYYILRQETEFSFLLSIRKMGLASSPNFIYDESFRKSFLDECGCEALETKKVSFRNFDGIVIKIKTSLEGKTVIGYTVGVISSDILFNINFLATESKFDSLIPEFEKIMRTLVFR